MSNDKVAATYHPRGDPGVRQPKCARCGKRHRPDLACWRGRYAQRIASTVLRIKGRRCWMCGERATSADHITPRSVGGGDELENLRPACSACNSGRGAKLNPFRPEPERRASGLGLSSRWRG